MGVLVNQAYPKVVAANRRHTLYFRLSGDLPAEVEIKVQPMETYAVNHAPDYLSHDPARYSWEPLVCKEDDLYTAEVDFAEEQRYSVRLRQGEEIFYYGYAYAVEPDLAALRPYKGDTHLHTNRSDGWDEPFDVACAYRAAGYDFIAVTDHGRYYPWQELAAELAFKTLNAFRSNCSEFINPFDGNGHGVIEYAWTASQFISLIVEIVFGISFNAEKNEVTMSPCVPNGWKNKTLSIKGLLLGGRTLDVFIENGCGRFSVSNGEE